MIEEADSKDSIEGVDDTAEEARRSEDSQKGDDKSPPEVAHLALSEGWDAERNRLA